tara:strand:- start:226 stop:750 length:525 start_codon:yes stop_codon:yes gene_type:complete
MKIRMIFIVSALFFLTHCGYQSMYSDQNVNFRIANIQIINDNKIGKRIERRLEIFQNSQNKSNVLNLEIDSSFSKNISSKDKQGNPKTFNINVLVYLKYIQNSDVKKETSFSENTTYNNQDDKFSLKNYEESLIENLTDKIIDNILIYLQSSTSGASNAKLTGNIGLIKSTNDN